MNEFCETCGATLFGNNEASCPDCLERFDEKMVTDKLFGFRCLDCGLVLARSDPVPPDRCLCGGVMVDTKTIGELEQLVGGVKMLKSLKTMNSDQLAKLKEVFGPLWQDVVGSVEEASDTLERYGLKFKAVDARIEALRLLKELDLDKPGVRKAKDLILGVMDALTSELKACEDEYEYPRPGKPKKKKKRGLVEVEEDEEEEYPYPRPARAGAAAGKKVAGTDPIRAAFGVLGATGEELRERLAEGSKMTTEDDGNPITAWAQAAGAGHLAARREEQGRKVIRYQLQADGSLVRGRGTDPIRQWLGVDQATPQHLRRPATSPDELLAQKAALEGVGEPSYTGMTCTNCGRYWDFAPEGVDRTSSTCSCGGAAVPTKGANVVQARRRAKRL